MSDTLGQSYEQQVKASHLRGKEIGLLEGALAARREDLLAVLAERFGKIPKALIQRIEAMDDAERLRACIRQAARIESLDKLDL